MALGSQIVNFVGLCLLDNTDDVGGIRHVPIMEKEGRRSFVRVDVKMIDPLGVKRGGAPFNTVNNIPFFEQQLGQVAAVLSRCAGDQRAFAGGVAR